MSRYGALLAALLAIGVLAGCGNGSPAPSPPDSNPARIGADRKAPALGITGDRRQARYDAEGAALDESRDRPVGSVAPPEPTQPPAPPPPASQL